MNSKQHVLVVDDEADIRALLEITLGRMNLSTTPAANLKEATAALERESFDLCLTDMRLPDGLGLDLVRNIHDKHPALPVAVITAYGNMEDAVESLKAGAFDFVTKPVDIDTLRRLVNSALKANQPISQTSVEKPSELSGNSPAMQELRRLIGKVAKNQAPVHISGESGTGKELTAKMIHSQSARADKPFVPVNCGAVPSELMESEFFGHLKGSFTGAVADNQGLFRAANGGTLFLDEVGDLPIAMQVKLLRAIQERKVRPVGSGQEVAVDVRIISATHKSLSKLVQTGAFREDLFYRLNVIDLVVPSLRDRMEDIDLLCTELLQRIGERIESSAATLTAHAQSKLASYHFPGNVRELENILERATALAENGLIQEGDLKFQVTNPCTSSAPNSNNDSVSIDERLAQTERQRIEEALRRTRYNKTKAAEILGISFRSLRYRLKKLGID